MQVRVQSSSQEFKGDEGVQDRRLRRRKVHPRAGGHHVADAGYRIMQGFSELREKQRYLQVEVGHRRSELLAHASRQAPASSTEPAPEDPADDCRLDFESDDEDLFDEIYGTAESLSIVPEPSGEQRRQVVRNKRSREHVAAQQKKRRIQ